MFETAWYPCKFYLYKKTINIIKVKKRKLILVIALLGMGNGLLVSCKSMAQKKSDKAEVAMTNETVAQCSTSGDFPLDMVPVNNVRLTPAATKKGPQLPKKYVVYTINNEQMRAFFQSLKSAGHGHINLPVPGQGCQAFHVENSGTMSEALAAKFPEIVSLKGTAQNNKAGSVRVDYDGKKLKAEITWENRIYYIQPWEENGTLWYVLSDRKDTGYEKQPFE